MQRLTDKSTMGRTSKRAENRKTLVYISRVIAVATLIVMLTAALILAATNSKSHGRHCFVVDAFPHHIPATLGAGADLHLVTHTDDPPLLFGDMCVDASQEVVRWRFSETYSHYHHDLGALALYGPLEDVDADSAPLVASFGLTRNSQGDLAGSILLESSVATSVQRNSQLYYVSLSKLDRREVARSAVRRSGNQVAARV